MPEINVAPSEPSVRNVPTALPKSGGRPFTGDEAEQAGLTYEQLRRPRFRRLFRDVFVAASLPDSLRLRCDGALLALPKEVAFSHRTAAALRSLPVPDDPLIHATVPAKSQVRIAGIRGHEGCGRMTSAGTTDVR